MNVIYTANFCSYDQVNPVTLQPGWRALCFTDNPEPVKGWEIIHMDPGPKLFRHIKICPHLFLPGNTELSVWMDANLSPKMPLNHVIKNTTGYTLMEHPMRVSIFEEAQRCKELRKDDEATIDAQMERYRAEKYPDHPQKNGLVATGVIIRTPGFEKFGDLWWSEVEKGSVRDQLSWNYCQWKTGLKYKKFPFLQNFKKEIHFAKRSK